MTNKLSTAWQLLGNHGISWLGARLAYEVQVRSGLHERRFPQRPWANDELARWLQPGIPADPEGYAAFRQEHNPRFLFQSLDRSDHVHVLRQTLDEAGCQVLADEADSIRQGRFRYFSSQLGQLGFPPEWHCNPFSGQRTLPSAHWSRIPMFSPVTGDLKFVWEPGRFSSAYTLSRAYWVSSNEVYAETFWQLVESWASENQPNHGAHWRCGQETSLRLMAWCFALYAFANSPATTPERLALLVGMVAAQADRVSGDHVYASLQKNNHAISEGVGLWAVGILFPELKMAEAWREAGRKILDEEAVRQIYADGAYIQHSTNYHRVMLYDYLWAIRIGELNGYELSPVVYERIRQAGEFLYQLQDEASGHVPNYGSNDGALILPLNGCDYQDFRPVLGVSHYQFHQTRLYQPGLWDEDLIWFFGPAALETEQVKVERRALNAPVGGYYTLRGGDSWGMIRCATFRDRPSQADGLHLDIWRNGVNVACDPGTYLYYAEPPWDNALVTTHVHNTVSVNGLDQMKHGPRFLWLNWLNSWVYHHLTSEQGLLGYFEGAHDGYHRLQQPVTHRRAVLKVDADIWIIVDDLVGEGEHDCRLHWLLADLPFEADAARRRLVLNSGEDGYGLSLYACLPTEPASTQFEVVRGTEARAPRGWQSVYYGVRHPVLSVTLCVRAALPCRLVSIFAPEEPNTRVLVSAKQIRMESIHAGLVVNLLPPSAKSIVQDVHLEMSHAQEHLAIG